jgi:hypothetical protein
LRTLHTSTYMRTQIARPHCLGQRPDQRYALPLRLESSNTKTIGFLAFVHCPSHYRIIFPTHNDLCHHANGWRLGKVLSKSCQRLTSITVAPAQVEWLKEGERERGKYYCPPFLPLVSRSLLFFCFYLYLFISFSCSLVLCFSLTLISKPCSTSHNQVVARLITI